MEQIKVKRQVCSCKDILNKKVFSNITFIVIISLLIIFLITFIALALIGVLIRGIPNLWLNISIPEIQYALELSLSTSIISTLLCIVFALPVAYGIVRFSFWGKRIMSVIFEIPISLPPIVSGLALLILFGNTAFGHFLSNMGMKFVFSTKGIIIAQFFVNVPYMIRVLKSTIKDIDPRVEFISRTLGCTRLQSFYKITLPLAKNGLVASIVITWARALGEFGAVLMLAGATRMKTETLPASLYLNMSCGELGLGLASATILIIISALSLLIFELLVHRK